MLVRSRDSHIPAAAGGRGAQATHRGPIGGGARPAAHHDRAGRRPGQRTDPCPHPVEGQPGRGRAGLDAAIYRKPPARSYRRRLDGQQEARLVALTCSAPPEGHKRWTLRLLADRLVALQVVESVSYETVRQALKQTGSSRG